MPCGNYRTIVISEETYAELGRRKRHPKETCHDVIKAMLVKDKVKR